MKETYAHPGLEKCARILQSPIEVKKTLANLHPIVERERNELKVGKTDWSKVPKRVREFPRLDMSVSKNLERRALLIMDAVVRTAERLGFQFREPPRHRKGLWAYGYRELLKFKLREPSKRILRPPTEQEKKDMEKYEWKRGPIYEYQPTGQLLLDLDGPHGFTSTYSVKDGAKVRVEDGINRFFQNAINQIDDWERRRLERVKEERAAAELEQRRVLEEQKRKEIYEREQSLFREANQWNQCNTLRRYVDEVKSSAEENEQLEAWAEWAYSVADKYDPTVETSKPKQPR